MKKIAEMLLLLIFFLLLLISAIFPIFTANNFWPFIFAIAFVYNNIYLEDLSPENGLLIEYDNQNKNEQFCDWKRQYPKWSFVSDWTRLLSKNAIKGSWNMIEYDYYPNRKINSDWSNPHIRVEGAPTY